MEHQKKILEWDLLYKETEINATKVILEKQMYKRLSILLYVVGRSLKKFVVNYHLFILTSTN